MSGSVLISICIPAYKRVDFLKRLLDSIEIQTFKSFEVIVTDDSPDENVQLLCAGFKQKIPLYYQRNPSPLGTPENWNEAIRLSKGGWIKLMHDDDWFADEFSLQFFADSITAHPGHHFFFSAYRNLYEDGRTEKVFASGFGLRALQSNPVTLFGKNIIGPPSVTLTRNDKEFYYDKVVKWVVDIDFYIMYLQKVRPVYLNKVLINVGLGSHQVTRDCARQRPIEIPENFYLLNKVGLFHLKNILVYDAWWRLMRNLEITSERDIRDSGYQGAIPFLITSMIRWQQHFPAMILKIGFFSKAIMCLHYLLNKRKI